MTSRIGEPAIFNARPTNMSCTDAMPPRKPKTEPAAPPDKPERKTAPVQISTELARMAAVIAAHDDISVGELLSGFLRPYVEEHYRRVQREIAERVKRMDAGGI